MQTWLNSTPTPEAIIAVRQVVHEWDGANREPIRHVLRALDYAQAEIDVMTWQQVRQAFAVRQRDAIRRLGGKPETNSGTVVSVTYNAEPEADSTPKAPRHFSIMTLCGCAGKCSTDFLHKYAVKAGVSVPRQGDKGFQFSEPDAIEVLRTIARECSHTRFKTAAEKSLREVFNTRL